MPFTDIHSHILPGFDDGARGEEEFLEMSRIASAGGTARMVATPHCDLDSDPSAFERVAPAVERHAGLLDREGIALELLPGLEVRVNAGLFRAASEGALAELRLGGRGEGGYILTDLPPIDMPTATADILFQVQLRDFTPILAHPERNRYLCNRLDLVREMVERGIVLQVNAGSLEGIYGRAANRCALALLDHGLAGLVASDAHAPSGRGPDLSMAARILSSRYGEEAARVLLEVNPGLALAGKPLLEVSAKAPRHSLRARFARSGRR